MLDLTCHAGSGFGAMGRSWHQPQPPSDDHIHALVLSMAYQLKEALGERVLLIARVQWYCYDFTRSGD